MTRIKFAPEVINNCTLEHLNNISEQLSKLMRTDDLLNYASSITYDADGYTQVIEIKL